MRKKLNILITASEVYPFAKTGGLADVVGALPKELKKMGHDVRVVMPKYNSIDEQKYGLKPLQGAMGTPLGIVGEIWCGIYEGKMPNCEVPIYFIDHEQFFGRKGIYTEENGEGYMDNDNRFVFFSKACLQLCKKINFNPDVIHANDWHTSAIPVFLNTSYKHDEMFWNTASLLTIHNMQHQGAFYPGLMDVLDIGWEHFNYLDLENDDQVNLLKGGIYHSTLINTVSEGYAKEIQSSVGGWGLEGVVKDRSSDLYGILNGIDYDEWNPEKDKHIIANYSENDLTGKVKCKADLQKKFGLPVNPDIPLFGIVSRLANQKGIDVLAEALYGLFDFDIQIVMLGTGEVWSHFYFGEAASRFPQKFGCHIGYSDELAHQIEAGSDFFLMPSRFEPCGLNQIYSLRYGTLPIVRATGGLEDTVESYNDYTGEGTGFKFGDLTASSLHATIGWALYTYYNKKAHMLKMIKTAMEKRFTWETSAKKYEDLYYLACCKKKGYESFKAEFDYKQDFLSNF